MERDVVGIDAGSGAFAGERGDGAGVGEQELCAAAAGDEFVEVVGGGWAGAGADALGEVAVVEQAEVGVVDELVFLAFAQGVDGELELVLGLVHRVVVEVGDAGVDAQDGLRDAELVLAWVQLVVDERAGQGGFALVAGGERDLGLAGLVLGQCGQRLVGLDVRAERLVLGDDLLEDVLFEREHGAGRDGLGGEVPEVVGFEDDLPAEVVAVGPHVDDLVVAVLAGHDLVDLAVGDEHDLVGRRALLDDHVAGLDLLLFELARQRGEPFHVVIAAQERDLAQFGGDDLDV